ncbi:MAG: hypothetical protein H6993_16300 [Pseudomonadales bacterium]|nr:hypothetical protein [Pseudomonadales bacterium]MCP5185527.1 hypothetical protein [Pseudomonadales bacterium]
MDLLAFFNWLDASFLARMSKAYGGVFAVVQMFHLLALVLLGGAVVAGALRMLGVLLRDVPRALVLAGTWRVFDVALVLIVISGIFMSSAVAMKLYYNEMFWVKMAGLLVGMVFMYGIERPLLRRPQSGAWPTRLVACASLATWFTVAAAGRWIGFS